MASPEEMAAAMIANLMKGDSADGRHEKSGSFNAMVSHRVRVTDVKEVDAELIGWLREAYDRA